MQCSHVGECPVHSQRCVHRCTGLQASAATAIAVEEQNNLHRILLNLDNTICPSYPRNAYFEMYSKVGVESERHAEAKARCFRQERRLPAPAQVFERHGLVQSHDTFNRLTMGFIAYFFYFFSVINCIWAPATLLCCLPWVQRQ
jgi:hypothetical protein